MTISRTRSLLLALPAVLALALGASGCGDTDEPGADPAGEQPAAADELPGSDAEDEGSGGAAGGSTMRVYSVPEAKAADIEGSIHVVGLLIDEGSGWRLCDLVMESHPPQCGGEALEVEGLDAAELPLEESGEVRWQTEATVVGEIDGDTLTVTGSPAAS